MKPRKGLSVLGCQTLQLAVTPAARVLADVASAQGWPVSQTFVTRHYERGLTDKAAQSNANVHINQEDPFCWLVKRS